MRELFILLEESQLLPLRYGARWLQTALVKWQWVFSEMFSARIQPMLGIRDQLANTAVKGRCPLLKVLPEELAG